MADIFASLDIMAQASQPTTSTTNNAGKAEGEPGLFDSLMTEYSSIEIFEAENLQELPPTEVNTNLITFKGGKLFSNSVIDILADMNDPEPSSEPLSFDVKDIFVSLKNSLNAKAPELRQEVFYSDEDIKFNEEFSQLLDMTADEFKETLQALPEDVRHEVETLADEIISGGADIKPAIAKLSELLNTKPAPETRELQQELEIKDKDEDIEIESQDSSPEVANAAGIAGVPNINSSAEHVEVKPEEDLTVSDNEPHHTQDAAKLMNMPDAPRKADTPAREFEANVSDISEKGELPKAEAKPATPKAKADTSDSSIRPDTDAHKLEQNVNMSDAPREVDTPTPDIEAKPATRKRDLKVSDNTPHQAQNVQTSEDEIEPATPETNFREVIEQEQNNFTEDDGEDQNQNFNQARDNFSDTRNQSRGRNDSRRASTSNEASRSQNDRSYSATETRRTDSRSDFQSFFEGVLNNRRTVSRTSPRPLELRSNVNFTRSETLRNGLVNVVRFIRADGVHKANVVIDPPALGRISVELTSGTSGVEASIKVASEQIRQLVQDQLAQLRMNLADQGVQVADFTVDVQQDSQRDRRDSQDENSGKRANVIGGVEEEEDTEEFRVDLEEGLLYWVA